VPPDLAPDFAHFSVNLNDQSRTKNLLTSTNVNFVKLFLLRTAMPNTITSRTDTLTELLTHLVRMPTVSTEPRTNRAALDWVEQQLAGLPLNIQRLENHGSPSLIATTTGTADPKSPKLWLAAHMDVVAGHPEDFHPHVQDGRLYGRGSHDMKFAIATYIALLQELGASLSDYDLGLLITCDEEVGGSHGVGWLVQEQGIRGEVVLLPDSSTPWKIEDGGKGIMWWQLTSIGRSAHASKPWQGVNAIDELMRYVNIVRAKFPSEPCGDPEHKHPTFNLSTVVAGSSTNKVPDSAVARIDVRYTSDLNTETIKSWFSEASSEIPTITAKHMRGDDLPYHVKASKTGDRFAAIAHEVTGKTIESHTAHGSSDARWFAWKGVPTINIGITGSGYHTSPEWVSLHDLEQFYQLTHRFVTEQAKK
jgi:succinyl-diaminopimelate desuccinylase